MQIIKPLGDRILIKICRETEKKVGDQVLTLATSSKRRVTESEGVRCLVLAVGDEVPDHVRVEQYVVARPDSGVGLSMELTNGVDVSLYRIVEYPELLASLLQDDSIGSVRDIMPEKVVINGN